MFPHGGKTPYSIKNSQNTTRRTARISEHIREAVSQIILFELKDPRIGFVTILEVTITPDVKEATVYLSIMGTPAEQKRTLAAINHAKGYLQKRLGKSLRTRNTPKLTFKIDTRSAQMNALEDTFEKIRRERAEQESGDA